MSNHFTPIDIILADDHEIFRDGFSVMMKKIPEINLVGEASSGEQLVREVRKLKPDIVVTDIIMPKMNGIEATKIIKKEFPHIGIIALSMFNEDDLIVDMLEAGATGYLLKNAHKNEIVEAIKAVNKDELYYCKETSVKLAKMIGRSKFNPGKKPVKPDFSPREIDIIKLICNEKSNQEIAEILSMSKRTVEGYRLRILEKINAKNTAGIVIYAIKNKIFQA